MFRTLVRRAADSTVQVGRGAAKTSSAPETIASIRTRYSTNIAGINVHPTPLTSLSKIYTSTLSILDTLPADSVYKQATAAITSSRLEILEAIIKEEKSNARQIDNEDAIANFEEKIDQGLVEEVINQAEHEMKLATKMLDWKPSEQLEHPPPPGQWVYFNMAEEQQP
ncbi:unnamed protein product [Sympodiomycopsis kandeliae]